MFRSIFLALGLSIGVSQVAASEVNQMLKKLAEVERSPQLLQQALVAGEERVTLCVHCHGKDGNSTRTYIPNLASQNAAYLFTQFEYFANGTRTDYVMSKLAQGLSSDDKIAIALYFADQKVQPRQQVNEATDAGQQIYQRLCIACHGEQGYGNAQHPRIAGQPYEFLEKTLLRFYENDSARQNTVMAGVVKNLTKKELLEVAAFVTNMP